MINAFLMIGQSNMSGRGALDELPPLASDHVHVLRDGSWEIAEQPIVRDRSFSGEGMGLTLGGALYSIYGKEIGFLPCSLGGSPLDAWQPGCELFENAVNACRAALETGSYIAGILWHQGEGDSEDCALAHTYLKRFAPMISALKLRIEAEARALNREELVASPMPVIVGELGDYLYEYPSIAYHREVNSQLHEFAKRRPEYACVMARDLPHKGDKLHFSAYSQRVLGLRYACAWQEVAARTGITLK